MLNNPIIRGGANLPTLTNPGTAGDLLSGKQLIDQDGNVVNGTLMVPGTTWQSAVIPLSMQWHWITYGMGIFVAISDHSIETGGFSTDQSMYSTDGLSWNASTLPSVSPWFNLVYGNGRFIATTNGDTKAAYSLTGKTWISSTLPLSANWCSIAYGAGKFILVAYDSNTALATEDGTSWSTITLPDGQWSFIVYGGGKFVLLPASGTQAAYSTNGTNWITRPFPSASNINSAIYGNGKFVALSSTSNQTKVIFSSDAITWGETSLSPPTMNWGKLSYGAGKFIIFGVNQAQKVAFSTDAENWTEEPFPLSAPDTNICYGKGRLVGARDNHDLATSTIIYSG